MHFIYSWETGAGDVFYIGQGIVRDNIISGCNSKYPRAYAKHHTMSVKGKRIPAYCQVVANKLKLEGNAHIVKILYDNLSKDEANDIEIRLINEYGRRCDGTGVLCNITMGGYSNPMNDPIVVSKHRESIANLDRVAIVDKLKKTQSSDEYIENHRNKTFINMNNPEYKSKWLAIFRSESNVDKMRTCQKGRVIEYDGITYMSIGELSRAYSLSKQTTRYRINNNIRLDKELSRGK